MTREQQAKVDRFHERVIALILRRSRAQRYNDYREEEKITTEINLIEAERRRYERDVKSQRSQKPEIEGVVSETEAGTIREEAETNVRP